MDYLLLLRCPLLSRKNAFLAKLVYNTLVILTVTGFMLFDLVDILQKKRRLLFVVAFIIFDLWLLTFCNQTLQAHRPQMTGRIHEYEVIQSLPAYRRDAINGDDLFAGAFSGAEVAGFRALVATTDGITKAEHSLQVAGRATAHATAAVAIAAAHGIGAVISGTLHIAGNIALFTGKIIAFPFVAVGHGTSYAFKAVSNTTSNHLASVIQPKNDVAVPVITPEQAQQVSIIQSGTLDVKPVAPIGSGGACDNGAGNGGYPMAWCDARMDSIPTVSYSADRINRECTSYAFWYFTQIEGHTDFHVTGNANRWANTSNYPTHADPAVGAIAVETRGYYGHVAIVQALPGQTHDGKVVPDGYVLVSEMNYDWQGHFRYSYSPLSKFSAYIYP